MTLALSLELASPAALWALAAAVPVTALHLYFRRRRRVLVPFAPLLVESTGPVRRSARFRRLQDALALGARLLALACAAFALAGLRPAREGPPPEDLILVVDADVTTAAREEGGGLRLAQGLAAAEAWVRSMPRTGDEAARLDARAAVVLAERTPRLLVPPTRDRALALRALGQLPAPAAARTDLAAAVGVALDVARTSASARVVVLTARPYEPPAALASSVRVEVRGVGRARDDQSIVDWSVHRRADEPAYDVRASVRNDAAEARSRALEVRVGDEVVASEDLALDAGERREVRFEVPAPREGAWLTLALGGEDAFPASDRVDAWLAPQPRPSVLVVHDGTVRPYTSAVMAALAATGYLDEARSGYVRASDLGEASPRDVVIVDGVPLPDGALRPGAYVFLGPLGGALPFRLGRVVEEPLLWRTVEGHPLLRDLDFRRAHVVRGQALEGAGLVPLAYAEGLALIAEGEHEGVRYVALGLDPEGSALPAQDALPLLVRNAIVRLARAPVAPLKPFYRSGDALRPVTRLPGGPVAAVRWEGPAGDAVLHALWAGSRRGRVDPRGAPWRVPAGAAGRCEVRTGPADRPWRGRTGLFDADPARTVVPVREAGALPAPAPPRADVAGRWRLGLLAAVVLLLLLDLLLARRVRLSRA